jgi:uncharacterized protein YkwD
MIKNTLKKKKFIAVIAVLSLSLAFFTVPDRVKAQAGSPSEMLQEINNLRSANGLSPLSINNYLMMSAQNHANWIAETGQGGHTGEGGSTAYDRALAVGYGEGKQIWVTENWAEGYNLSVYNCIYDSWNDAAHMDNMLTTWHNEFGAGVATVEQNNATLVIYVVNFGHSGSAVIQPTITPGGPTSTSAPIVQPVVTATPNPDGSVIHVVQYGQTLWAIADAYDIPLEDLLSMNNLTEDSAIFPDEELLIIPGDEEAQESTETTDTPKTQEATVSPTPAPTRTERKSPTPTLITAVPTENPNSNGNFFKNIFSGDTLWVGIGLIAVSVFGIVLLLFTSARLR